MQIYQDEKEIVFLFRIYFQLSFTAVIISLTPMSSLPPASVFFPKKSYVKIFPSCPGIYVVKEVTASALISPNILLIPTDWDLKQRLNGNTFLESFSESWL